MKKKLLICTLLLVSCNGNNSSIISSVLNSSSEEISSLEESSSLESISYEDKYQAIQQGILLDIYTLEDISNGESRYEYYSTNAYQENQCSLKRYKNSNKDSYNIEYYVTKGDDAVYATRLGIDNQYIYYPLYNGYSGALFSWNNDGYRNVFSLIEYDELIEINNHQYEINPELFKDEVYANGFSTMLYGNPGIKFSQVIIDFSKNKINAKGFYQSTRNYEYSFDADIIDIGKEFEIKKRVYPFEEIVDEKFSSMIASLKGQNYQAKVEEYVDDVLVATSQVRCTKEAIHIKTSSGDEIAFVYRDENTCYEYSNLEGQMVLNPGYNERNISSFQPQFNISPSCFDKENDTYTLKKGVDGDKFSFVNVGYYAEELEQFTIEIFENKYIFTNIVDDEKVKVTFFNIGNVELSF